jgi:hypothetical protein
MNNVLDAFQDLPDDFWLYPYPEVNESASYVLAYLDGNGWLNRTDLYHYSLRWINELYLDAMIIDIEESTNLVASWEGDLWIPVISC